MKNRPQRQISFLVVWLTMFSFHTGWGQKPWPEGLKRDFSGLIPPGTKPEKKTHQTGYTAGKNPTSGVKLEWPPAGRPYGGYPVNMRINDGLPTAFFCKMEWEMEKTTHIPLRFRLGSLADCDALEGKH